MGFDGGIGPMTGTRGTTLATGGDGGQAAGDLILVLGGARTGKSDFAQRLATRLGGDRVLFVATAEAADEEMARRIAAHRRARPAAWRTVEATRRVGDAVRCHLGDARAVVVDCLTLLVSNVLLAAAGVPREPEVTGRGSGAGTVITDEVAAAAEAAVREEVEALVAAGREAGVPVIVVSNEVGWGLVPSTPLARLYRDLLGRANQVVAAHAGAVYLLVAGIPLVVKGSPVP